MSKAMDQYEIDKRNSREDMAWMKERDRFYKTLRMKAHRAKAALDEAMKEIATKPENYTIGSHDFLGDLVACIEAAHGHLEVVEDYYINHVGTSIKP